VKRKPTGSGMQLKIDLAGDRRLAEDVILEIRALAQRFGLEAPQVSVVSRPAVGPKARKRARRASALSPRS
jgi:translation elongation factor EF-Tu-like GTPase